jgi:hypothetical protein
MSRSPGFRFLAVAVLATGLVLATPRGSVADEPLHVGWSELLPGLAQGYDPSSSDICQSGSIRCVDAVIREMERRFRPLAAACDHDAVFALTYLRTTERYRDAAADGTFFTDTAFVNHQDAVFADFYFRAFDDWHLGARSRVAPAWAVAFAAADGKKVSGLGNLLLGMSGHVNHDLPLALEKIGIVKPDGSSRKVDHDRVNRILQPLVGPLLEEVARRFDPAADDGSVNGTTLDETTVFQLLAEWREEAWRNAELLVSAPTPAARNLVASTIAQGAAAKSRLVVEMTGYRPPLTGPAARDAFCAQNG